jgi:hypothetical protein
MKYRSSLSYPTREDWLKSDLRKKFVTWFADLTTLQNARVFLLNNNKVSHPTELPGYFQFVRDVFYFILRNGYAGAVPLIESDRDLFKGRGFSGDVLRSLALLQGIRILP